LADAVQDLPHLGLRVLPSDPARPGACDLVASEKMKQLLRTLEAASDLVLVDSPPLSRYVDAAVLAAETDAALLVIGAGRTGHRLLRAALAGLTTVNARLLGVFLVESPQRTPLVRKEGWAPPQAEERDEAPDLDGPAWPRVAPSPWPRA
jgi:Mrp family chromosome partitioning ATPase